MQSLTIRRCTTTCLVVLLLTAAALFWVNRFGTGSRVVGRTGGVTEQGIVRKVVDDPREAYALWKQAGYRGRVVVYIADRWESFDPGTLIETQMYRGYPLSLYNTARLLEAEHLNGVTFLYVAMMNRLVRKIVAVVPQAEVERMRALVPGVKDSRSTPRGVFLSRQGFSRWYTTGANFSAPPEPVLLYVGASYFRYAEPEDLLRQLASSGLTTDCVMLCREVVKPGVGKVELEKLDRFARLLGMPAADRRSSAAPARPAAQGELS